MTQEDFDFFRQKIFFLAGISMSEKKIELLQSRLRTRVTDLSFETLSEYKNYLRSIPDSHPEWELFINQLTTNKTEWFREAAHFKYIVDEFLPKWKKLAKKHLAIWSTASSTGEEAYTLSLVLHEALKHSGITYSILSTDIDTEVLKVARNGVYPRFSLEHIPSQFHRLFMPGTEEISQWIKVRKEIKDHVTFSQVNLTQDYHAERKFDLVLCRNILIYFNTQTRLEVSRIIHKNCFDKAILLIGHSESLQNTSAYWNFIRPSIYEMNPRRRKSAGKS